MTYAPASIKQAQTYLHDKTGLAWAALGIIGDRNHDGGYHCGWDRRRIRDDELADYSWEESARDSNHRTDAASALDIGNWPGLRAFSRWLVAECERGAPDTLDIREVIYSPDGKTVKRWDRLGERSSGDSSHLYHTHISYHRDAETRDKTGLFRRYFEDLPAPKPSIPKAPSKPSKPTTSDWLQEVIMSLPTLRRGSKGAAVKRLQGLLVAAGRRIAVDGIFGPNTEAAVKVVQQEARPVDGIVGRITWTKLIKG